MYTTSNIGLFYEFPCKNIIHENIEEPKADDPLQLKLKWLVLLAIETVKKFLCIPNNLSLIIFV